MCTFRLKSNVGCCPCGVLSCLSHVQEYLNKYLNLYFYVRLRLPSVLDCFSRTHAYTDLVYISRVLTWLQSVLDCMSGSPSFGISARLPEQHTGWMDECSVQKRACPSQDGIVNSVCVGCLRFFPWRFMPSLVCHCFLNSSWTWIPMLKYW